MRVSAKSNLEDQNEGDLLRLKALARLEILKREAGLSRQMTPQERLKAWRDDFAGTFCPLLDILPKDGPIQKLSLNPIQKAFNDARTGRDYILKARQVGFTTMELARDVWYFLTHPGARVVIVCQSITDDAAIKELGEKIRVMIESLRNEGIPLHFEKETTATWVNRSMNSSLKIIGAGASEASASKKGRSGTIHRLHITELSVFEHGKITLNAVLECVPKVESGTEIVVESTPNGAAGAFYEEYKKAEAGTNGYTAHFFPWHKQAEYRTELLPGEVIEPAPGNHREQALWRTHKVSPEQLKWFRAKVNEKTQDLTDQEYPTDQETCWLVSGRMFFDKKACERNFNASCDPSACEIDGALWMWMPPQPGAEYLISADPSEGTGGDPGAAIVRDRDTGEHVATIHGQYPPWVFGGILARAGRIFNTAMIAVERNNHGHAVLQALRMEHRYARIYRGPDGKPGWNNTEVSRSAALDAYEHAHRNGHASTRDIRLVGEQRTFIVNKNGKAEATSGAHDDLLMADVICWDILRKPANARTEIFDYTPRPDDEWT